MPSIDPYLFELQFQSFSDFVESKAGVPFSSFASNPYTQEQEGYKYSIYHKGRDALSFQAWKKNDIGKGEIVAATIQAIEIPESNLIPWQARFGAEARPHQPLYKARDDGEQLERVEEALFQLFLTTDDDATFPKLVDIFGKSYPLIAYLYFLKDRSRYVPIAPTFLDRAFAHLGTEFKTSRRCSWENYLEYIGLLDELKILLSEQTLGEVTLLDAHSFAWMLSAQMESEGKLADAHEYKSLSNTERQAIIKARIGQGQFRDQLISHWKTCAVTGCAEIGLLRASHIKPWSASSITERLSLYNGLLLSPALDACLDRGYISFDNDGRIMLSERLSVADIEALGLDNKMYISGLHPEHAPYLSYHRKNLFK